MAISRSDMNRQLYDKGGIITLEDAKKMAPPGESLAYINPEEAALLKSLGGAGEDVNGTGIKSYFFKKVFKKAKKTVSKVLKSPIGKAALLAGGAGLLGGVGPFAGLRTSSLGKYLMGSKLGAGVMGPTKTGILQNFFLKDPRAGFSLSNLLGKGLTNKGLAAGIGGLSGIAGLMAAGEQDENDIDIEDIARGEGLDIADIVRRARMNDPEFRFLPGAEFTSTYASGGKVKPSRKRLVEIYKDSEIEGELGPAKDFTTDELREILFKMHGDQIYKPYAEGGKVKIKKIQLSDLSPDFKEEYLSNVKEGYEGSIEDYIKEYYSEDALDGFKEGGNVKPRIMGNPAVVEKIDDMREFMIMNPNIKDVADYTPKKKNKRTKKAKGGIMNLDGFEMDLRGGGFVPLGAAEKADDVPARLSKNEFVMTADAVRAAGGGSIDKGADKMYKTMKQLESMV